LISNRLTGELVGKLTISARSLTQSMAFLAHLVEISPSFSSTPSAAPVYLFSSIRDLIHSLRQMTEERIERISRQRDHLLTILFSMHGISQIKMMKLDEIKEETNIINNNRENVTNTMINPLCHYLPGYPGLIPLSQIDQSLALTLLSLFSPYPRLVSSLYSLHYQFSRFNAQSPHEASSDSLFVALRSQMDSSRFHGILERIYSSLTKPRKSIPSNNSISSIDYQPILSLSLLSSLNFSLCEQIYHESNCYEESSAMIDILSNSSRLPATGITSINELLSLMKEEIHLQRVQLSDKVNWLMNYCQLHQIPSYYPYPSPWSIADYVQLYRLLDQNLEKCAYTLYWIAQQRELQSLSNSNLNTTCNSANTTISSILVYGFDLSSSSDYLPLSSPLFLSSSFSSLFSTIETLHYHHFSHHTRFTMESLQRYLYQNAGCFSETKTRMEYSTITRIITKSLLEDTRISSK
jgi:hypothetical protein